MNVINKMDLFMHLDIRNLFTIFWTKIAPDSTLCWNIFLGPIALPGPHTVKANKAIFQLGKNNV